MKDREYRAHCDRCGKQWYLRLYGITDSWVAVRCPRCGGEGVASPLNEVGREGLSE